MQLHEFSDRESFLSTMSNRLAVLARKSAQTQGYCAISLSGGRTPKPLYGRLNELDLPWNQMHWIMGDERWVPPTEAMSNEHLVKDTLGVNRPEFERTFWSWHLSKDPQLAAESYENRLTTTLGPRPAIDLILLGLGEDGHTASLFPGTPALTEKTKLCLSQEVPSLGIRQTLTYPVLNAAKEIWFIVEGAKKKEMVSRLMAGDRTIPAACISNRNQSLFWLK